MKPANLLVTVRIFLIVITTGCSTKLCFATEPDKVFAKCPLLDGEPIMVPVQVGTRMLSLMLDTGCTVTLISERHLDLLGPKIDRTHVTGAFTSRTMDVHRLERLSLGSLLLGPLDVNRLDVQLASDELLDDRTDGVLGCDVVRNVVVQLDPDSREARLLSRY